jgi:hypothetical protein
VCVYVYRERQSERAGPYKSSETFLVVYVG